MKYLFARSSSRFRISRRSFFDRQAIGKNRPARWQPAALLSLLVLAASAAGQAGSGGDGRPENDDFANAIVLSGAKVSVEGTTEAATGEAGEPNHEFADPVQSVWYQWQADADGRLTVDTAGSEFQPVFAAYQGTAVDDLRSLGSRPGFSMIDNRFSFAVEEGEVYFIAVAGEYGMTGDFRLNLLFSDGSPTLRVFRESLLLDGHRGGWETTLTLGNYGEGELTYTMATDVDWLTIAESAGSLKWNETRPIVLEIGELPEFDGTLEGSLTISSNASNTPEFEVPVTLTDAGIYFPDDSLWRALSPNGFPVYPEALAAVDELGLESGTISDLTGLAENAPNLRGLDIGYNRLTDLSLLANLTSLEALYISDNFITDLTPLLELENLEELDVVHNMLDLTEGSPVRLQIDQLINRGVRVRHEPQRSASPENDNFADATELTGNAGTTTGNTTFATAEPGEPSHFSGPPQSVWYQWTATVDGYMMVDTRGSLFDTTLAAYAGDSLDDLEVLAVNDDFIDLTSAVAVPVESGTTYRFAVDGYGWESGAYTLSHTFNDGSPLIRSVVEAIHFESSLSDSFESSVMLWNEGVQDLEITGVQSDVDWLVVESTSVTIERGESVHIQLEVTALPDVDDDPVATITVTSNAQNAPSLEIPVYVTQGIAMPDPLLREQIVRNQDLPSGSALTEADMAKVTRISLFFGDIFDLTGMEYAANATSFIALSTQISDLTPLQDLPLRMVFLSHSNVTDLAPLLEIETLEEVYLERNFLNLEEGSTVRAQLDALIARGVYVTVEAQRPLPPANDDFADAQTLRLPSGTVRGNTVSATGEPSEPVHGSGEDEEWEGSGLTNSLWYRLTAPEEGPLVLNLSSDMDAAYLTVYTGDDLGSLEKIKPLPLPEEGGLAYEVEKDETYHIAVDSQRIDAGSFDLHYRFGSVLFPVKNWAFAQGKSAGFGIVGQGGGDLALAAESEPEGELVLRAAFPQISLGEGDALTVFGSFTIDHPEKAVSLADIELRWGIFDSNEAGGDIVDGEWDGGETGYTGYLMAAPSENSDPVAWSSGTDSVIGAKRPGNSSAWYSEDGLGLPGSFTRVETEETGTGTYDFSITVTHVEHGKALIEYRLVHGHAYMAWGEVIDEGLNPDDPFAPLEFDTVGFRFGQSEFVELTFENVASVGHFTGSTYLSAPEALTAKPVDEVGILLDWKPVYQAENYEVFRGETDDFSKAEKIATSMGSSWIDGLAEPGKTYHYWVRAAGDDVLSDPSDPVEITWQQDLHILTQPKSLTIREGETLELSVEAAGTGELTYQWFWDGQAIPNQTSNELSISYIEFADAGIYRVTITDANGSVQSSVAVVTVTPTVLEILEQPESQGAEIGAGVTFSVDADGFGELGYQWFHRGLPLEGETSSRLTISPVTLDSGGDYHVEVNDERSSITSASASLRVLREDLEGAESLGDGYYGSDRFGTYYGAYFEESGWIYHFGLRGWLYLYGEDLNQMWMWSELLGWIWTGESLYPYLYWDESDAWLYYLETGEDPRWFHDAETEEWKILPETGKR